MLKPSQFTGLLTEKFVEDPTGAKIPLYEYEEEGNTRQFAIMEAKVICDRGHALVRLHSGLHYVFLNGVLYVKVDANVYKTVFKGQLKSYSIAYVTEATHNQHLEEIRDTTIADRETLEQRMYQHARDLEFEDAAQVRDQIRRIREAALGA